LVPAVSHQLRMVPAIGMPSTAVTRTGSWPMPSRPAGVPAALSASPSNTTALVNKNRRF